MNARGDSLIARLDRIPIWPYGTRLLVIIGAGYFFAYFDIVTIGLALPVITDQFHISTSAASTAVTSSLVGYIAGSLAASRLADLRGRRISLLLSVGMFTLGTIGAAFSFTLPWLVGFRFLAGMGIGAEIAVVTTYVGELAPARLRGRATSLVGVMAFAGFAVVPVVARFLVPAFDDGWRVLFLVGAAGGLTVAWLRRNMPPSARWLVAHGRFDEADKAVAAAERHAQSRLPAGLPVIPTVVPVPPVPVRKYVLALFTVLWLIYYVGNYGWLTMAPTLLTKHAGYSLTSSLTFLVVTGTGFVVGAGLAAVTGDRLNRKFLNAGAATVWSLALLAIGVIGSPAAVMVFGFVSSATIGYLVPLMYAYTAEHFPTNNRATSVAIADGIGHLGGAAAPIAVLWAANSGGFVGAFVLMAATGAVTVALLLLIPAQTAEG